MQSTRSSMLAAAAIAAASAASPIMMAPSMRPYGRGDYPFTQRSRSKAYPEQSTRQALRGQRRQQKGPGLPSGAIGLLGEWGRMPTDIQQGDRLTFRIPRA